MEESPPEPAPPEVPPRGPSLHAVTLRNRAEYSLPLAETLQKNHESQFMAQDGMFSTILYIVHYIIHRHMKTRLLFPDFLLFLLVYIILSDVSLGYPLVKR